MDATKFGLFIAQLRKDAGMTQLELANKLHVTVQAISKWECGKGIPDINTIEPLANVLNVSIAEIMKSERITTNIQQEVTSSVLKDTISFVTQRNKMQTKKMLIKGFLIIVISIILIWFGIQIYGYHHPWLEITYATGHSEDFYRTVPHIVIKEKSIWGCSSKIKRQLNEWSEKTEEMELYLSTEYEKPKSIVCNVYTKDGETIFAYDGFAKSKNGNFVKISERIIFDFIITENIRY